jgi:hypothetical protein
MLQNLALRHGCNLLRGKAFRLMLPRIFFAKGRLAARTVSCRWLTVIGTELMLFSPKSLIFCTPVPNRAYEAVFSEDRAGSIFFCGLCTE